MNIFFCQIIEGILLIKYTDWHWAVCVAIAIFSTAFYVFLAGLPVIKYAIYAIFGIADGLLAGELVLFILDSTVYKDASVPISKSDFAKRIAYIVCSVIFFFVNKYGADSDSTIIDADGRTTHMLVKRREKKLRKEALAKQKAEIQAQNDKDYAWLSAANEERYINKNEQSSSNKLISPKSQELIEESEFYRHLF